MALKIRLSRNGAKNNPHFSIVVGEARSKRDGQYVEKLGHYHPTRPTLDESRVVVNAERIKYWVSVGALPTPRVATLVSLKADGLLKDYIPTFSKGKYDGMTKKAKAALKKEEAKAAEEARKARAAAKAEAAAAKAEVKPETAGVSEAVESAS